MSSRSSVRCLMEQRRITATLTFHVGSTWYRAGAGRGIAPTLFAGRTRRHRASSYKRRAATAGERRQTGAADCAKLPRGNNTPECAHDGFGMGVSASIIMRRWQAHDLKRRIFGARPQGRARPELCPQARRHRAPANIPTRACVDAVR